MPLNLRRMRAGQMANGYPFILRASVRAETSLFTSVCLYIGFFVCLDNSTCFSQNVVAYISVGYFSRVEILELVIYLHNCGFFVGYEFPSTLSLINILYNTLIFFCNVISELEYLAAFENTTLPNFEFAIHAKFIICMYFFHNGGDTRW